MSMKSILPFLSMAAMMNADLFGGTKSFKVTNVATSNTGNSEVFTHPPTLSKKQKAKLKKRKP